MKRFKSSRLKSSTKKRRAVSIPVELSEVAIKPGFLASLGMTIAGPSRQAGGDGQDKDSELTQRTQKEESTEFTEKREERERQNITNDKSTAAAMDSGA